MIPAADGVKREIPGGDARSAPGCPFPTGAAVATIPRMVTLTVQATGATIGQISDDDLRLLQSVLEEEGPEDKDYWIDLDTIDLIESRGGSAKLLETLRNG